MNKRHKKINISLLFVFTITLVLPLFSFVRPASAAPANVPLPSTELFNDFIEPGLQIASANYTNPDTLVLTNESGNVNTFTFANGLYYNNYVDSQISDEDINGNLFGCRLTNSGTSLVTIASIFPNNPTDQDLFNEAFEGTDYSQDGQQYTRGKSSPYIVISCHAAVDRQNPSNLRSSQHQWNRVVIGEADTSVDISGGNAVGVPAGAQNGTAWLDYRGTIISHASFPTTRFKAISPYEIVDTATRYPGGQYVTYAITQGTNWGGGGQQRLFNDGINVYWPLKESALTKTSYTADDYDFRTTGGACRGGFNVKTGSPGEGGLRYGRIYAVPTRTNGAVCGVVDGSVTISTDTAYGHFNEGSYPNGFDLSRDEWYITTRVYSRASTMQAWFSYFYWIDQGTIGAYGPGAARNLTKWAGNNSVITNAIGLTGANLEVYTTRECTPASGTPSAFIVIDKDPNLSLRDIDTGSTSATGVMYRSSGSSFTPGWNGEDMNCIMGQDIEENVGGYVASWVSAAASGNNIAAATSGLGTSRNVFIAYPSRSVNNADGGNSNTGNGTAEDGLASEGGNIVPSCESTGGFNLSYILCPIINGLTNLSQGIFNTVIEPFLRTEPISTVQNDTNTTYAIWVNFRTLGNILLIFGLLFVVFGQSIGGGIVDAYTAKKALPRILVVAVLINLSIFIVAIMVDITNVIGAGIGALITAPVKSLEGGFEFTAGSGTAGTIVAVAGVAGLAYWLFDKIKNYGYNAGNPNFAQINQNLANFTPGGTTPGGTTPAATTGSFLPFLLLFVLLPIALITLSIFATLIIRRGLILFLIIVSPVALALYILPQTEKYAKKWFDTLLKTLMVYPIIVAIFSIAYVLSITIINANDGFSEGTFSQFLAKIIGIVVLFIPLLMIPFAFKLAGGAIASIYGALTGFGKKGLEAIKGNEHNPHSMRNRAKGNAVEGLTRYQARAVIAGRALGASSGKRRLGRFASKFGNVDARLSQLNADAAKSMEQLSSTGDDTLLYAAMGWRQEADEYNADGSLRFKAGSYYSAKLDDYGHHKEISKDEFDQGKKYYGSGIADIGNVLRYRLGKAQTDADVGAMRTAFEKNAIAGNWSGPEASSVWAAATYPHKDKFGVEWYSAPSVIKDANGRTTGVRFSDVGTDTRAMNKLLGDKHKTQQAFQLGSMRDDQWRAIERQQQVLSAKLASGQQLDPLEAQNFAMASEILDAVAMSPNVMYGDDGKPQVSGVSAASKGVIESIIMNRQYTVTKTPSPTTPGQVSANERDIVEYIANPDYGKTPNQPRKVAGNVVQTNIPVTGDINRTGVPGAP